MTKISDVNKYLSQVSKAYRDSHKGVCPYCNVREDSSEVYHGSRGVGFWQAGYVQTDFFMTPYYRQENYKCPICTERWLGDKEYLSLTFIDSIKKLFGKKYKMYEE